LTPQTCSKSNTARRDARAQLADVVNHPGPSQLTAAVPGARMSAVKWFGRTLRRRVLAAWLCHDDQPDRGANRREPRIHVSCCGRIRWFRMEALPPSPVHWPAERRALLKGLLGVSWAATSGSRSALANSFGQLHYKHSHSELGSSRVQKSFGCDQFNRLLHMTLTAAGQGLDDRSPLPASRASKQWDVHAARAWT
jgi:hypothetical protein